jgi:hypothetical protein
MSLRAVCRERLLYLSPFQTPLTSMYDVPHTRGFHAGPLKTPPLYDSGTKRVEFELTGDLRSGLAINNRRADDHCPRIPLRVGLTTGVAFNCRSHGGLLTMRRARRRGAGFGGERISTQSACVSEPGAFPNHAGARKGSKSAE